MNAISLTGHGAAVTEEDLRGVIWQVWTAYLDAEPAMLPTVGPAEPADVTASVCVAGSWQGHVVLRASLPAAAAITAAMLDMPAAGAEQRPDDVQDATGELMNIVTGNIKSLLPQPSHLSLPQVVMGKAEVAFPGAVPLCGISAHWQEHVVIVEVHQAETGFAPPA